MFSPKVDIAILTVIPQELAAVKAALRIQDISDNRSRTKDSQTIYLLGKLFSERAQRNYSLALGCIGSAGNYTSSQAATEVIQTYKPKLVVLVGIAAGIKDKSKLGEVVFSEQVVGYEPAALRQSEDGTKVVQPRPDMISVPNGIHQDVIFYLATHKDRFDNNQQRLESSFQGTGGVFPTLSIDDQPYLLESNIIHGIEIEICAIASGEKLLKDPSVLEDIQDNQHGRVKVGEMEAIGFAKACQKMRRDWLVIRGVSDFGDTYKSDVFQPLASQAVATVLTDFLKHGLDLPPSNSNATDTQIAQGDLISQYNSDYAQGCQTVIQSGGTAYIGGNHIHAPQSQNSSRILELQLATVSAELERVSSDFSEEIDAKLEEIRELGRKGLVQSAQDRTRELQDSENWKIFTKPLQAKILRTLAGYEIALNGDVNAARNLLERSAHLDPEADATFIRTLIRFHADGVESALAEIDNITDSSILNLKLALLLEINRSNEAIATIQTISEKIQPNTETQRLHALALLMEGNILEAQQKIQEAITANPEWEMVREAEAIINYHSALSSVALQKGRFPLPEPVDRAFIKHDNDSLDRLRKAEAVFGKLASETERMDELRQHWRVWQLACLANDPSRQDEAKVLCQSLLAENPKNTNAIIWAIFRNYEIDLAASQKSLEQSLIDIVEDRDAITRITVLLWLYLNNENFQATLSLLEQTRGHFEKQGDLNYWLFWHVQSLLANGNSEAALQETETLSNSQVRYFLKTSILREIARESDKWYPVIEHLENCFKETQNGKFLYECCYLQACLQDWNYVADRAEILIEEIGTPEALTLAVECSRRAKRLKQCVELLSANQRLFPNNALPNDLHHLKVWCLMQIGSIMEALAEAEALVSDHETANNLATLIAVQFRQGDMHSLVITARRLLAHNDVLPMNFLQAARLVQPEDLRLARQLWEKAVAETVDPEILGEAIDVGFKLSLDTDDSRFRLLLHQAQLLAHDDRGPFKPVALKEFISLQRSWAEHASELNSKYDRGELPIHLLTEAGRFPLINLFLDLLQKNVAMPNPHRQQSVLVRHGSRSVQMHPLPKEFRISCSRWRLHLDISAFLLANYLKILKPLEDHFKPLMISASFQPALARQLQMLQSHQPSRLELHRHALDLVRRGVLRELPRQLDIPTTSNYDLTEKMGQQWVALLEKVKAEGGYLVEFLPLERLTNDDDLQPVFLTDEDRERIINCRSLLEAIKQSNLLTENQYQNALNGLGDQGYSNLFTSLPKLNASVFLMGGTASVLAEAKILNKICQYFQVYVDYIYLEEARLAVSLDEQRSELIVGLSDLIERVRDGLVSHTYETVILPDSRIGQELVREGEGNLDLVTAFDLFRFEPQPNDPNNIDVIWIDDRFLNQFLHRDGIQIVTIIEILNALLALDVLSQDDYFDKLLQLRKANTRYIPITSDEIIYWLKQALIVDGYVKETEALAVLRKYIASCLLDTHRLQLHPRLERSLNPQSEVTFVLSCLRAIEDAMVSGWLDNSVSNENALAYANWVLINLYTGTFGTRHFTPITDSSDNSNDLIGLDTGGLYMRGVELLRESVDNCLEKQSLRQEYFTWLNRQFTERRFKANSNAVTTTARAIHLLITESKVHQDDMSQEQVIRYIYQQFYYDLPASLCTEIKTDLELMNWLDIQTIPSIQINSISLPVKEFWQSAVAAVNGSEATIIALEPKIELKIQSVSSNSLGDILEIKSQDNSIVQVIDDALFQLLSDDQAQRVEVLRSHRCWLDCDNKTLEGLISEIASIQDPRDRFERAKALREQSADFFYKKLDIKLEYKDQFNISELMPPSAQGLLRHFRLESTITSSDDFHAHLSQAAQSLISEEGIEEALERMVCLPVKLPSVMLEELRKLNPDNRHTLLNRFAKSWASPVCKFHLIDLALGFPQAEEIELVKHLLDEIYSDAAIHHFNLFSVLLQLVDNAFSFRSDVKEWSVPIRLAMTWAHASRLQNIMDVQGLELQEFIDNLRELVQKQVNLDRLNRNPELWDDVLQPHHLDRIVLAVHGFASLLQDKSSEILNQAGIIERIEAFAVKTVEGHRFPNPQLFRDPALARDSLRSILGGDRGHCLAPILGSELAQYLESASLKSIIEGAIQNLKSDQTVLAQWSWLRTIVGDIPIYGDLRDSLKQIIGEINIAVLFKIDSDLGLLALDIASNQINYVGDEKVRLYLENQLLSLISLLAEQEAQEKVDENLVVQLIEIIFRLSVRLGSPHQTTQGASDLIIRAVNTWQKLANSHLYAGLFKLIQELPIEQLSGFWRAFLHLRALRSQQI